MAMLAQHHAYCALCLVLKGDAKHFKFLREMNKFLRGMNWEMCNVGGICSQPVKINNNNELFCWLSPSG
jgi:hypothetical protein